VAVPREAWKRSSVRHNLLANLGGKALSLLISLICVPIYIRILGIGGYGLIGIWMTLETIANLIDLGLSPTITREMAGCSTRAGGAQEARDLVRTLEAGYWLIGVLIGGIVMWCASPITFHWLQSNQLPSETRRSAIVLIGILIACRWPLSFYGGGLTGLERQVLLSGVSTAYACLRSLGSVLILVFVSPTIGAFFEFQIAINIVQTAVLTVLLWRCLPAGNTPRFRPELVRRIWRFAGGASACTLAWLVVSELDKVVVSAIMPLESFGYYALGSRVAACVNAASWPLFAAFFPALSRQVASGDERKLADLYHRASQIMSVLVLPSALTVVFFAKPLIFAWTGNEVLAGQTASIAALLTAGSAVTCIVSIPLALQLAYGWTSLSFWSNTLSLFVSVPMLLVFTEHFGGAGAASVWLLVNLGYFVTQVIPMHRRLLRSEKNRWFCEDVGIPLIACTIAAGSLFEGTGPPATRIGATLIVIFSTVILASVAILATPLTRQQMREAIGGILVYRRRQVDTKPIA
jgi:O-antigen/teichoic acid export membrane protein